MQFYFVSFLAVDLHLYSITISPADFSSFSTVPKKLVFRTPSNALILLLLFLVMDVAMASFNLSAVSYNLSGLL